MEFETKALTAETPEIRYAFDDFLGMFEQFKSENDERLRRIEKKSSDVLSEEKIDRMNRALDEQKKLIDDMILSSSRPQSMIGSYDRSPHLAERKSAFDRYVRKGDAANLDMLERKAMNAASNADGGYAVPLEIEQTIDGVLKKVSPLRAISTVRQIGTNTYRKPIATTGASYGWVSETLARPQTDSPTIAAIDFPTMELYAMPAATQTLLDDVQIDLGNWLADEVQNVFAEQEGTAFINGNGTTAPKGILTEQTVADTAWVWGKIGYVATGAAAGFSTDAPADALVTLAYAPKQAYRANGTWVMNRATESVIRKFKDTNGNYVWQPGAAAGQPTTLLGYPVVEADDMPDIAADACAIAFGDFARGYLIVDRIGIRVLRDPYSAKPYVLFYTTKRVGGGIQNFEALKFLKFSAN